MTWVNLSLPFLLLAAFLLAAARSARLRAAALIVPIGVATVHAIAWPHERQPPAQGDSQPGLVAFVGLAVTTASVVAVALGWLRHRVRDGRDG
jgi:hypothetical protein